jgi:hypothetical protein
MPTAAIKLKGPIMDISRHWRLKTSRSQMVAVRCPASGELVRAEQTGLPASQPLEAYRFDAVEIVECCAEQIEALDFAYVKASR